MRHRRRIRRLPRSPSPRADAAANAIEALNHEGSRETVGLLLFGRKCIGSGSGDGSCEALDLKLKPAIFGMIVLANAIGDVDLRSFAQTEFRCARGHMPADGPDGAAVHCAVV